MHFDYIIRKEIALAHLTLHSVFTPRDAIKLAYQATYGPGHLLADQARARAYLEEEWRTAPTCGRLTEPLSDAFCRVNLGDARESGIGAGALFALFADAASGKGGDEAAFEENLETLRACGIGAGSYSADAFEEAVRTWRTSGGGAVHHSAEYRAASRPAYRVMDARVASLLPLLALIAKTNPRIIAIDGRCASGKSTLSRLLSLALGADVIHMDDFFLPPALRTEARFSEIGGNVDYDRFASEVLPHLRTGRPFSHRIFDCSVMALTGVRALRPTLPLVVEGSYSHHTRFGGYADLRVFVTTDPQTQRARILARNGETMAKLFETRFIPMEEAYFEGMQIRRHADFTIET